MAPILYCKCSNCICTATVLLKQERREDKNATEDEEGHVGEEAHHVGEGQEYTYFIGGWERPTDTPLVPAEEQDSWMGSIVLLVVLVLLAIGEESRDN